MVARHPPGGVARVSRFAPSSDRSEVESDGAIRGCPAFVEGIQARP